MSEGMIVRRGGAGSGIVLKIKGGTTVPANPTENLVWVNTSTTITNWEISYDAPTSPIAGMVWVKLMDQAGNDVVITRRNPIVLRVGAVNQYIDGEWTGVDASIYQNGSWSDLVVWAYQDGEKYVDLTGGYVGRTGTHGQYADRSDTDGYLYIYDNGGSGWRTAAVYSQIKVDMTNFNKLHMECIPTNANGSFQLAAMPTNANASIDNALAVVIVGYGEYTVNVRQIVTLDISSVSEEAYICARTSSRAADNPNARLQIYKFWFT